MDYNRIEELLDKYFEGGTSVSEENELKAFFSSDNKIPENLLYAKKIFGFFKEEKSTIYTQKSTKNKINKIRLSYISGIAASILIAMFFVFSNVKKDDKIIYAYINGKAITDKNIAEKYTKQALLSISQNLDKGTKNLSQLNQLNKVEMLIKKEK